MTVCFSRGRESNCVHVSSEALDKLQEDKTEQLQQRSSLETFDL